MARNLKIVMLFLSLGIMMIPKQMIVASSSVETCCYSSVQKKYKDCAGATGKAHQDNSCKDDCSNCVVCAFYTMSFPMAEKNNFLSAPLYLVKKDQYSYITPSLSSGENSIWQPPKIG